MTVRTLPLFMAALLLAACSSVEEHAPAPNGHGNDTEQETTQQTFEGTPAASEQETPDSFIGMWQSTEDSNLTVRYGADGTVNVVSIGQGGMAFAGTWTIVDPATEDIGVAADTVAGITVLRLQYPNATAVYVGIKNVTATTLQTVELTSGGKGATFTKVQ